MCEIHVLFSVNVERYFVTLTVLEISKVFDKSWVIEMQETYRIDRFKI